MAHGHDKYPKAIYLSISPFITDHFFYLIFPHLILYYACYVSSVMLVKYVVVFYVYLFLIYTSSVCDVVYILVVFFLFFLPHLSFLKLAIWLYVHVGLLGF